MSESSFIDLAGDELVVEAGYSLLSPGEIVLGKLVDIDANGCPLVSYPLNTSSSLVVAISTLRVTPQHIGRQAALMFADGDFQKPIILGFIYSPLNDLLENFSYDTKTSKDNSKNEDQQVFVDALSDLPPNDASETVRVDGKKILIEGKEEVVLSCGESSITLTKAGKIIIRGKYLLSRSSGVNRILGGSVQVN